MNFYYDPILGLVYREVLPFLVLDLDALPREYTYENFMEKFNRQGMQFVNSKMMKPTIIQMIPSITADFI